MTDSGQKKVIGSNNPNAALLPFSSRDSYLCANAQITKGVTSAPTTLKNCFDRFPFIEQAAKDLGITLGSLWTGYTLGGSYPVPPVLPSTTDLTGLTGPFDLLLDNPSDECIEVSKYDGLGKDWLGCLWGSPEAPFSCICPEFGKKFPSYMKLRQNVATFWNTKKDTPVKRQEFLDAIQYGRKVEITTSGDFSYSLGDVVEINVTGIEKIPDSSQGSLTSDLNGKYWVVGVKHVLTNSGNHESRLLLTQMAINTPQIGNGGGQDSSGNGATIIIPIIGPQPEA
jgi:hypothetical protein